MSNDKYQIVIEYTHIEKNGETLTKFLESYATEEGITIREVFGLLEMFKIDKLNLVTNKGD